MADSDEAATGSSFCEVLRQLSISATDVIFGNLEECSGSLAAARLTCRSLRSCVDGSVRHLFPKVGLAHRQLEQIPCMSRWSRTTELTVQLNVEGTDDGGPLVLLAFAGQPLECRQRVTSLDIVFSEDTSKMPVSGVGLAATPMWLPGLQKLDLGSIEGLTADPLQLQLLFQALAVGLPLLEELKLPSTPGLAHVGALRNSLRCLSVYGSTDGPRSRLTEAAVASITQLVHLEELELDDYVNEGEGAASTTLKLLNSLPKAVTAASLFGHQLLGCEFHISVKLTARRITEVTIAENKYDSSEFTTLLDLACVVDSLILPCQALAPRLERLCVGRLKLICKVDQHQLPTCILHLDTLKVLVSRSDQVELHHLRMWQAVPNELVLHTVEVLGLPETLQLSGLSMCLFVNLKLTLRQPGQSGAMHTQLDTAGAGAATAVLAAQPMLQQQEQQLNRGLGGGEHNNMQSAATPAAMPSPATLLGAAIQCMATAATEAAASAKAVADSPATDGRPSRMLMLQGPFVGTLAVAPAVMHEWLRWLAAEAAGAVVAETAAAGEAAAAPEAGRNNKFFPRVQVLPLVSAVLLQCSTVDAVAAVSAVVARVAAKLPAGTVEVTPLALVASLAPCSTRNLFCEHFPAQALLDTLQEVVQGTWDADVRGGSSSAGNSDAGSSSANGSCIDTCRSDFCNAAGSAGAGKLLAARRRLAWLLTLCESLHSLPLCEFI